VANKGTIARLREVMTPQQSAIIALMLIPDSIAIAFSAITAYLFRFAEDGAVQGTPAIANFDYKGILASLVIAWILFLVFSGVYRFNHANLVTSFVYIRVGVDSS
jgi:hypothetical protein